MQSSVEKGHTTGRPIDTTHQNIDSGEMLFGSIRLYNIEAFLVPINIFKWIPFDNKIIAKHNIEGIYPHSESGLLIYLEAFFVQEI